MHAVPDAALFSRSDALVLGWTDSSLMRAVRSGRVVRVRRGQFASAAPDPILRAIAAARSCRGSVISHRSADLLHGLPLLGPHNFRADLTLSPPSTGDTVAALVHRATLRPQDVVVIGDCAVTSVARTVVDLGRSCPTATAVAAIDFALHERLTTRDEIADVLDMCRLWPRAKAAARAVQLADARTESPLESVSRLAIAGLHLPPPEPQVLVLDERGFAVARLDFYWDEFGVGGEADGRRKYDRPDSDGRDVFAAEKDRHERAEDLGVAMTHWRWAHATRDQAVLRTKIDRAFDRGRARDATGLRRRWSIQPSPIAP